MSKHQVSQRDRAIELHFRSLRRQRKSGTSKWRMQRIRLARQLFRGFYKEGVVVFSDRSRQPLHLYLRDLEREITGETIDEYHRNRK